MSRVAYLLYKSFKNCLPGRVTGLLIVCCLLLSLSTSYSQTGEYLVEKIPLENELSGLLGNFTLQDSDGFIWFGFQYGLYRYDGSRFKGYFYDPFDSASISGNFAYTMIEDKDGIFWIGSNGLNRFDRVAGKFKKFLNPDTVSYNWQFIRTIIEDENGILWLGTDAGLSRFDKSDGSFKNYPEFQVDTLLVKTNKIEHMIRDTSGNLWLHFGQNGLCVFHKEDENIEMIKGPPVVLKNIYLDHHSKIWITSYDGLYLFDRSARTFKRMLYRQDDPERLANQAVMRMTGGESGNYWIKTFEGIYKYNSRLEKEFYWKFPEALRRTRDYLDLAPTLYLDNNGIVWFFTKDGIYRISEKARNFKVYNPHPSTYSEVYHLQAEGNDKVWFTDKDSLFCYNQKTGFYDRYLLPGHKLLAMKIDREGTIWIGTESGGVLSVTKTVEEAVKFENYLPVPGDSNHLQGSYIDVLCADTKGRIWIRTKDNMPCYYDRDLNRIIHLVNNPDATDQIPVNSDICLETNSHDFIGLTPESMFRITPPFIKVSDQAVMPSNIKRIKLPKLERGLANFRIFQSSRDSSGVFWMLTWEYGLIRLTPNAQHPDEYEMEDLAFYLQKDGLSSYDLWSIIEDDKGNFWLGTGNGLARFDPVSEIFTIYTVQHGLPSNLFTYAVSRGTDREFFFGTHEGLISFFPDSLTFNRKVPLVVITDLKVNHQLIEPGQNAILEKTVVLLR